MRCYRAALAVCPPGHADRAELLTLLGSSLALSGGGPDELTEAVELHRDRRGLRGCGGGLQSVRGAACLAPRRPRRRPNGHLDRTIEFLALAEPDERRVRRHTSRALTDTRGPAGRGDHRGEGGADRARPASNGRSHSKRWAGAGQEGRPRRYRGHARGRRPSAGPPGCRPVCACSTWAPPTRCSATPGRGCAVRAEARVAAPRHGDRYTLAWLDSSRYVELFWEGAYAEALANLDEAIVKHPASRTSARSALASGC